MAAAKWNKRRHFEQEVLPELDVLFAAALYLARDQDEANDLCEKTIVRAYRSFDRRMNVANYRAWLLRILHEIVRAEKITGRSGVETKAESTGLDQPPSLVCAGFNIRALSNNYSGVDRALHELPDDFRAALVMVDVAELTYHDAAKVLAVPIETVRARISQGRALMRPAVAQLRGPGGFARA
jgi:RNA polymerase sigma-70 factor, ECF subfamily